MEQLGFVKELVIARTGFCRSYLVHGSMQREPSFTLLGSAPESLLVHGYKYNLPIYLTKSVDSVYVPSVLGSSWLESDELGITLMNFCDTTTVRTRINLTPSYWGLSGAYTFVMKLSDGSSDTVSVDQFGNGIVDLPPRRVVLIIGEEN